MSDLEKENLEAISNGLERIGKMAHNYLRIEDNQSELKRTFIGDFFEFKHNFPDNCRGCGALLESIDCEYCRLRNRV